jgi:hypothetical protein
MKEQERKKRIKINKAKRRKRSGYKKELKRFDPILKEIFSKAAGKIRKNYIPSYWREN